MTYAPLLPSENVAAPRDRPSLWALVPILMTGLWLLLSLVLFAGAALARAPFFGETPSAYDLADAARLGWLGAAAAVGLPLVGVGVARRHPRSRVLFVCEAGLGFVVSAVVLPALLQG